MVPLTTAFTLYSTSPCFSCGLSTILPFHYLQLLVYFFEGGFQYILYATVRLQHFFLNFVIISCFPQLQLFFHFVLISATTIGLVSYFHDDLYLLAKITKFSFKYGIVCRLRVLRICINMKYWLILKPICFQRTSSLNCF